MTIARASWSHVRSVDAPVTSGDEKLLGDAAAEQDDNSSSILSRSCGADVFGQLPGQPNAQPRGMIVTLSPGRLRSDIAQQHAGFVERGVATSSSRMTMLRRSGP